MEYGIAMLMQHIAIPDVAPFPDGQDAAVALSIAPDTPFKDWLALGKQLAFQHRNMGWLIGDWVSHGQTHYGEQFALALPEISDDPKAMRKAAAVAQAFPPALRDTALTYTHYSHLADLPRDEALALITQAKREKLTARQTRIEAINRKAEIGQTQIWAEDDYQQMELVALARAWNRACNMTKDEFRDMIEGIGYADIDP
jgi:hypothetical protein